MIAFSVWLVHFCKLWREGLDSLLASDKSLQSVAQDSGFLGLRVGLGTHQFVKPLKLCRVGEKSVKCRRPHEAAPITAEALNQLQSSGVFEALKGKHKL